MRKAVVSAVVFAFGSIAALEADGQSPVKSFEEFRAGVRGDYNSFRRSVLADYDKFLDGVWADYEVFKGASRSNKPKPATLPHAEPSQPPVAIPAPEPVKSPEAPSSPKELPNQLSQSQFQRRQCLRLRLQLMCRLTFME